MLPKTDEVGATPVGLLVTNHIINNTKTNNRIQRYSFFPILQIFSYIFQPDFMTVQVLGMSIR